MPLTKVTTAITAATPMTTPSRVSAERSLFAHNERNAILMASVTFMGQVSGVRCQACIRSGLTPGSPCLPVYQPAQSPKAWDPKPEKGTGCFETVADNLRVAAGPDRSQGSGEFQGDTLSTRSSVALRRGFMSGKVEIRKRLTSSPKLFSISRRVRSWLADRS